VTSPSRDVPDIALQLTADPEAAGIARARIVRFAVTHGAGSDVVARVALSVTEAMANAALHAYPSGTGPVRCHADVHEGRLEIVVADRGAGFRSGSQSAGLGAGLAIIAHCCDDFTVAQRPDGGVQVWMRFVLPGAVCVP
jgi:anti-sigma regulatory factor (Ser/Thr protein kinase)